ncbi:MAG TPA: DUF2589 domain-containing protein [Chlorobiota bacterium]|nr:DUF2589 domain-containing protein [Chlorobiota bacterium]
MGFANSTLRSLPFGQVIGSPMIAAIRAQALAAQATVDFIKNVGFAPPSSPGPGTPTDGSDFGDTRYVVFKYTRLKTGTGSGAGVSPPSGGDTDKIELQVPILTIVPIPYIRIDEMTIDFTANITEQHESTASSSSSVATDTSLEIGYSAFFSPVKVGFNAKVSTRHNSNQTTSTRNRVEYTMDIHVRAVQDEMPAGLGRVLGILEEAILQRNAS